MSSYSEFAAYYDRLMNEDINYNHIADFIENIFIQHDISPELVCDLACGTGNITIPMAKRGYEMIAVDKSFQMLDEARKKASGENLDILFLNQNISKLDLFGTCDAFLCMIDGINYIINPQSLVFMFSRIKKCFINPGGLFMFDISSAYKLSEIIGNNTFIYDGDDLFYTWENKFHKDKKLSEMYLNFFIKNKHGYKRFAEKHLQRAYTEEEIKLALKKAGFLEVSAYDGFSFDKPHDKSKRLLFVAK